MKPVQLPVTNVDRNNGLVWVKSTKKGTSFPCKASPNYLVNNMDWGDLAYVVKSAVSGEWLCVDYEVIVNPFASDDDLYKEFEEAMTYYEDMGNNSSVEGESAIW